MYTNLVHLCHKQVDICTCVNVIIYHNTHKYERMFNDKNVSYLLMISERVK